MSHTHQVIHDPEVDATYIQLTEEPIAKTREIHKGLVLVDFDANGKVCGVEFVNCGLNLTS